MKKNYSIRKRLLLYISISVLILSLIIGVLSLISAYDEIEEVYDAQLAHSAKILLMLTEHEVGEHEKYEIELGTERADLIHRYENKLTFRIWKEDHAVAQSHLAESFGEFTAPPGFSSQKFAGEEWRFFVFIDPTTNITIEVAEKLEIRRELIFKIFASFWVPLLLFVPILFACVWLVVSIALRPILQLSKTINKREENDLTPIDSQTLPLEIHPLIAAMNNILERIKGSFMREQQFTDNAAHELRTPLAAMKTQTQVLLKKAAHVPECHEGLENLHQSIDRATHLVEQLLSFARLQSGELTKAEFDFSALCHTVIKDLQPLAEKRHVILHASVEDGIFINGNQHALEVMVKNLLDNAIKFSPEQETVTIRLSKNVEKLALCVSDHGKGIADQHKEKVLERFFRVHKNDRQGSGLGLAMVQWVADVHDAVLILSDNEPSGLRVMIEMDIKA
ncbi:MAG: ATP-binding protein [Alcanivorax sp.]